MPVLPQLQPLVEAMATLPPDLFAELPMTERRALIHSGMGSGELAEPVPASVSVHDVEIPVEFPAPGRIRLRVYTPAGPVPEGGRPAHLFLHGGAWWLGTVEHFDPGCGNLAALADCVVVSVDYRLAPEFPYPVALNDAIAAWSWLREHATELAVDPARMSIGGGSAGGNLAAAACLVLRDRGLPLPVAQVLIVPATDLRPDVEYASAKEAESGYLMPRAVLEESVVLYLGKDGDPTDPYVSPLLAETLAGLPPALVMTCEYDPVRDAGEAYARALREAGVPTTSRRWSGFVHNAHVYTALLPEARDFRAAVVDFLKEHHA